MPGIGVSAGNDTGELKDCTEPIISGSLYELCLSFCYGRSTQEKGDMEEDRYVR